MSGDANVYRSTEELSEEDQNLKNELEMLVSRLKVDLKARSFGIFFALIRPLSVGVRYQPLQTCP